MTNQIDRVEELIKNAMNKRFNTLRIQDFVSKLTKIKSDLFEMESDLVNFVRIEDLKRKKGITSESEESFIVADEIPNPTEEIASSEKKHLKELFIDQTDD